MGSKASLDLVEAVAAIFFEWLLEEIASQPEPDNVKAAIVRDIIFRLEERLAASPKFRE